MNQPGRILAAHGVFEGLNKLVPAVADDGVGRIHPVLEQGVHRRIARRDLIDALDPGDLAGHRRCHLQVVLPEILLHRLHADLEAALVFGEKGVDLIAQTAGRQRRLAAPDHLRQHGGGKTEPHLRRQHLSIAVAPLGIAAARDLRRDRRVADRFLPLPGAVVAAVDQVQRVGEAVAPTRRVQLADQRGVAQRQVGELPVQLEAFLRLRAEGRPHPLPEPRPVVAVSGVEVGKLPVPGRIAAQRDGDQILQRREPRHGRPVQRLLRRQPLEACRRPGERLRQRSRDHALRDRPMPDRRHGPGVGLVKGGLLGRQPGAEQGVEEGRIDAGAQAPGGSPGAELIRQGGEGDGTGIPAGLVGQIGDILAVSGLLEVAQPALEVTDQGAGQRLVLRAQGGARLVVDQHIQGLTGRGVIAHSGGSEEALAGVDPRLQVGPRLAALAQQVVGEGDPIGAVLAGDGLGQLQVVAHRLVHDPDAQPVDPGPGAAGDHAVDLERDPVVHAVPPHRAAAGWG